VYASTSSLYGNTDAWAQEETAQITPPNFYAAAKRAVEDAAKIYADTYGMTTIGLRNFSVFGYPERHKGEYANIITQFIWKMMKGESPLLYGDGKQTRDFTFVDDIARGIQCALDADLHGGFVFNLGTGIDTSFNEVVDLINLHLGMAIKPLYTPNQIHNYIFTTRAQVARAETLLGWKAETSLEEGIRKTIAYYKK
jgi:UDP-glucose 4-epimerase